MEQQLEIQVRTCERNSAVYTRVSEERGRGGTAGVREDIPLNPIVKTMVRPAVPLQSMEIHSVAEIAPTTQTQLPYSTNITKPRPSEQKRSYCQSIEITRPVFI